MAEASKRCVKIDDAIQHYSTAIDLLSRVLMQGHYPKDSILSKNYIDRAWIYLQNQQDLDKAKADLDAAQRFLDDRDRALISDFHNAMARWADQSELDWKTVFDHHQQAWLAAIEAEDVHRQINTGHNLGQDYVWNKDYERGLEQLNQVRLLAVQFGERDNEGLCHKSMGAAHFFRGDYRDAIHHYQQAAKMFDEIGNRDRLGFTQHDLAEAYCALGDFVSAKHHRDLAQALASQLNDLDLQQAISDLSARHTELQLRNIDAVMERQRKAMDYMRMHGDITNRAYRALTGVAQKQAARDLADMVRNNVAKRIGHGRSARYVLAF
jgi:tetratricopeptide (TPR) repeat protein